MLFAQLDNIIVKVLYAEKVKEIIIPDCAKEYSGEFKGLVTAIGPDYKDDLKVGDCVIFSRHEGLGFTDSKEEKYLVLKPKWVLAVYED